MNRDICNRQINKKPLIPPLPSSDNYTNYKVRQSAAKTKNREESNESNGTDYKNISLTMTGEISSDYIHRNSLTQKQPNITFIEDTEDDDEQFILNMKTIIDKNYKTRNKENFSIRDLQSKSYLSRKKKCAFSDEDQNLMKRFKRSIDESKASCVASQKSQQSGRVVPVNNHGCPTTCTPQITSIVNYNDKDMNLRSNTNELFFHTASKTAQENDQWLTPGIAKTVTEIEIEQLIYHEMQYFTPPRKDDL